MSRRRGRSSRNGRDSRDAVVELPEYLRRLGLTPRKALGQHFLIDEFVLGDIADACELDDTSTVLEIGAGPGGLTEELARRAARVVAVEIDEELAGITRGRLSGHPGVCVVAADILDYQPEELLDECGAAPPYVACGNLPYYITQPVVRRLLEALSPPERIIVMVQHEVARRLVGGDGHESLLSMSVRCYGEAELVFDVPSGVFWPEPAVRSTVVRINRARHPAAQLPPAELARFFNLLRAGYSEPRKQLHNTLRRALDFSSNEIVTLLAGAGIEPQRRAQHLALEDWRELYDAVERDHPGVLDAG